MIIKNISQKSKKFISIPVILGFIILLSGFIYFYKSANAADTSNFDAGNIISDSIFYNSNSMSVDEIQSFLNTKVTSCDTNHAGFTGDSGTTYNPPWVCLKDYYENPDSTYIVNYNYIDKNGVTQTDSRSYYYNNAYKYTALTPVYINGSYTQGVDHLKATIVSMGGTKPSGSISSAQIIYNVAQQYGINPKVLIVLLQKEQGLVTDTWPSSWQYQAATGYGCTDYAPCSVTYAGFSKQLASAAWQFKYYKDNPSNFSYVANRNNTIKWNPVSTCGDSVVYIHNQATAGLYNYTPYRPNSAALSAGYGTGDSCSSYGNRNFWLYFTDWFGTTTGPSWGASIKSQTLYSDSERTSELIKVGSTYIVEPGQTVYGRITALNTGQGTWNNDTHLGTSGPIDRSSLFSTDTWLSPPNRVSGLLNNSTIANGETGTFEFSLKAPTEQNNYKENFGIVQEGQTWIDTTIDFSFIVTTKTPYPQNYTNNILDSSLSNKTILNNGESLISPDEYSILRLNEDGCLILLNDFKVVWKTNIKAGTDSKLIMQDDGNLVLYNKNGQAVWNSQTNGKGSSKLIMQDDGNLVLYNSNGATWSSGTSSGISHLYYPISKISSTSVLYKGQHIQSTDRKYTLYLQDDGNLVLYSTKRALWATYTVNSNATSLVIQDDGNLVLYNSKGTAIWYSRTNGYGASNLNIQGDGNLVLYTSSGKATWSTMTDGKE